MSINETKDFIFEYYHKRIGFNETLEKKKIYCFLLTN